MWYVYVIESLDKEFRYKGMSQSPKNRLKVHNSGKVKSTKSFRPFELIYTEECNSRIDARKPETISTKNMVRLIKRTIFNVFAWRSFKDSSSQPT